jgi:hypothetical protein
MTTASKTPLNKITVNQMMVKKIKIITITKINQTNKIIILQITLVMLQIHKTTTRNHQHLRINLDKINLTVLRMATHQTMRVVNNLMTPVQISKIQTISLKVKKTNKILMIQLMKKKLQFYRQLAYLHTLIGDSLELLLELNIKAAVVHAMPLLQ